MLLTITSTRPPAPDLGYLLHKNPSRMQSFTLSFGQAHVFYPEVSPERCTAALLLDVDPVGLVRRGGRPAGEGHALEQYVNDRPYVASSFLSVAIAQVFGSALGGRSKDRPELTDTVIPLQARLAVRPGRGGDNLLRRLFEPLGYTVTAQGYVLDEQFPEWGGSRYFTVTLEATCRLSDLLTHLYVLVPVLDDEKHYWVGDDEVEKLLRHGGDWLASHPEQELIVNRYLKHQRSLTRQALARLLAEDSPDLDSVEELKAAEEAVIEELDSSRLTAFERVLFECARPGTVILTTPNAEYNVKFLSLPAGKFRHRDHRFEWTRDEFQAWALRTAQRFGYAVRFLPVGPEDSHVGAPTQLGVFS